MLRIMIVPIQDEESEQVEGLADMDTRPWATKGALNVKINDPYMPPRPGQAGRSKEPSIHAGSTFRPAPASSSKPRGKPLVENIAPVGRLGGLIPPRTSVPSAASSRQPSVDKPKAQGASSSSATRPITRATTVNALPSKPLETPDCYKLCNGTCQGVFGKAMVKSEVNFAMTIDQRTQSGYLDLVFSGNNRNVHNVLDLNLSVIEDQACVFVATVDGDSTYSLTFESNEVAKSFKTYLERLREAAVRHRELDGKSSTVVTRQPTPPATVSKTETQPLMDTLPANENAYVAASTACHSEKLVDTPERQQTSPLLDTGENDSATGEMSSRLGPLIRRLIPGFAVERELIEKEAEAMSDAYLDLIGKLEEMD